MNNFVFIRITLFFALNFLLLDCNNLFGQILNYNWSYGGSHNDGNYNSHTFEWSSGRFITATSKVSTDGDITDFQGLQDIWLLMHDSGGNIIWQKSFGGSDNEYPTDFLINKSKEFIIVGATNSNDGHFNAQDSLGDAFIMKTDSIGNLLWVRSYGGSGLDVFTEVAEDNIGNLYVVGHSNSFDGDVLNNHGDLDYWVLKLDSSGVILWNKSIGGAGREWFPSILYDTTGYIILSGSSDSNDSSFIITLGYSDAVLVKIDTSGSIHWIKNYGGDLAESAVSIEYAILDGYVFTGFTYSNNGDAGLGNGSSDLWFVKLDTSGNIIWSKRYGGSKRESGLKILSSNNHYMVLGNTESDDGDVSEFHYNGNSYRWDIWYLELDSDGNLLWNRCFGSKWDDYEGDLTLLSDGSTLITGSVPEADGDVTFVHGNNGYLDLWVVNFNAPVNIQQELTEKYFLKVFPNPFSDLVNISFSSDIHDDAKVVVLRDVIGNIVYTNIIANDSWILNFSTLPSGTYILECNFKNSTIPSSNRVLVKY